MPLDVVILTGQSGSGRTTAIDALEDRSYYCVDNLPPTLAAALLTQVEADKEVSKVALGMDIRTRSLMSELPQVITQLRESPHQLRVVYFESEVETLIRRYSETRRRHPLDDGASSTLREAILEESVILSPLRELADLTIETSTLTVHQLRTRVIDEVADMVPGGGLKVSLMSFGFKHGVPDEANLMFDVRFLPNPYFDEQLKPLSGRDAAVADFVMGYTAAQDFLNSATAMLHQLVPEYRKEGRRYLTVAIGCTGGQHRSVAMVEALVGQISGMDLGINVRHRDMKPKL